MRYIISGVLAFFALAGLMLTSQPASATSTVSGEVWVKPKTESGVATNTDMKRQIMLKITKTKKEITTLNMQISYVEKKLATRKKRKLDSGAFEKKLTELKGTKKNAEDTLAYLEQKLKEIQDIMMTTK